MKKKIVLICALENELDSLKKHSNIPIIYSGVGKINAAICAMSVIINYKPDLILNYGTGGSPNLGLRQLIECTHFFERDMDASLLGFKLGETPFESKEFNLISFVDKEINKNIICSSGDNFEQNANEHLIGDVFDMEAYSIAKSCKKNNVDFKAFKYISDSASESTSSNDWEANISKGIDAFQTIYDSFV